MKIIIAGSRDFKDYDELKKVCDYMLSKRNKDEIEIVSGTAKGADELGEQYAKERGYKLKRFPADWGQYGKRAGHLRNKQMSEYADALICFWDSESKGAFDMILQANQQVLKVKVERFRK
jgi:major membrane immunogen (membrane-anchored lipoprotein)